MDNLLDLRRYVIQLRAFFPANSRHHLAVDLAAPFFFRNLVLNRFGGNIVGNQPPTTLPFTLGRSRLFGRQRFFDQRFQFANLKQKKLVGINPLARLASQCGQKLLDRLLSRGQLFFLLGDGGFVFELRGFEAGLLKLLFFGCQSRNEQRFELLHIRR